MKAAIIVNNAAHQREHAAWMKAGLEKHGWRAELTHTAARITGCNLVVSWSVKHKSAWEWQKREGGPVLIMERAALQPRHEWTGCGFNGLAGRATYAKAADGGDRWRKHFAHLEKPWREEAGSFALVCGQVRGDAALWGVDFHKWAQRVTDELLAQGWPVRYRPHPLSLRLRDMWFPNGATFSRAPYDEDLAGAALVMTFNSTAGVEGVLAGVPTIACDNGSMAWAVTTHDTAAEVIRPDRTAWEHDLAWSCFSKREIEHGTAWEALQLLAGELGVAVPPVAVTSAPAPVARARPQAAKGRRALVLGGASCVWADIEAALDLSEFDFVVACNDIGAHWAGRLDCWATLHPDKMADWLRTRQSKGYPPATETVAHREAEGINRLNEYRWPEMRASGSSGLYAAKCAIDLGAERIVLCGIPFTGLPHFFNRRGWQSFPGFKGAWVKAKPRLIKTVRSMSGWTADFLGRPTAEWLSGSA